MSTDFTLNDKIKLIENIDQNVILSNRPILTQIGILNRDNLLMSYSQLVMEKVLINSDLGYKDKIQIFNMNKERFNTEFILSFLKILGGDFARLTEKGPKPSFEKKDFLITFFNHLKVENLISK